MPDRPSLLILSISRIVSDPRVLKQVALFRDRYEVSTCGQGPAPEGVARHFELPADTRGWVDDRVALLTRRYRRAYRNIGGVAAARAMLPVGAFDAVLANDLNTVPLALSLQPRRGVHADLHEFAPREKEDDLKWRLLVAPFLRWLCRKYLARAASITTVSSGIALEYQKRFGVSADIVTNASPHVDLRPLPVGNTIRLIHTGAAFRARRLENYIRAMDGLRPGISLDFYLTPNDPEYLEELKLLARHLATVAFHNPVPYSELVETTHRYDVALSVFAPTTFNIAHGLPNKFFEAIQARIGLIIGPSPEMARIVERYDLGAITNDFEVASLRKTIGALTPERIAEWKAAAHRAAGPLSAEEQNRGWSEPIARLLDPLATG